MATATISATPSQPESHYRITVDLYERMIETGILGDGDPIELIDGLLVSKMSKSPDHRHSNKAILKAFVGILPAGWTWQLEGPIRLPDFDEPEPEFAVVVGTDEDYRKRHPGPSDVGLVVEVAVTSLGNDRGKKLEAYATAAIPVYWIVNAKDAQVEVYTSPQPGEYKSRTDYKPGQLVPVVLAGNQVGEIAVIDILP
jgi:Uma2 family endonuclease